MPSTGAMVGASLAALLLAPSAFAQTTATSFSTRTLFSSTLESALGENRQTLSVVVNSGDVETAGFVEFRTDAQAVSRVPPLPQLKNG